MNPYLVGHRHLIRYGALDLVQGNPQEALNKVLHVLQQGSGPDLCDALMLRLFQSAATNQHGAAAALAGYMRLRWGDEQAARSLASLAPVLTQAPRDQGWTALAGLDWPGLAAAVQAKGEMPVSAPWPDISAGSRPLVVVGMSGGLGNQLFQYGVGLAWARRSGGELCIDTEFYTQVVRDDRRFWLEQFEVDVQIATPEQVERVKDRRHVQDLSILDQVALRGRGDVYLAGFWPSHIYLESVADELAGLYRLRNRHIEDYAKAYVGDLRRHGPVVAVHVRRGDNTEAYNRNNYLLHPPEFYRQAVRRFPPDSVFLVFSDTNLDLEWCRRELRLDYGARVEFSANHSFLFDFAIMRECDGHVLSVSSFSWWAAYLCRNPGQHVVMAVAEQGTGGTGAHYRQAERAPDHWELLAMPPHFCP
ncbi:alpha-1,2-fucosyltransferase [Magnetospirillum gryphiswaldense]|uniref:Alpha-1,2-fucosyltransferase n=1 Tax=Magnetospirillum gryphiswaldense TaxID=55518 RepID=A4TV70_9PROT|nr:alpha-1,2-fucosyltransferase [Magnetospirillum gryphiswaldense]AVM76362.1 Glycosyl transferase family 11 [Magnetospirillum gryphiswaldense MSR-1]AVM80265.1 Glycosyl transferase family 11 [Magnetospirillum gryphiswaldense]CAM74527.1 alpha-1,2-fucosyltransferase [Magnetospirillum gryphiswaldense MSR-1]